MVKIKVSAEVNGNIYKSKVNHIIKGEEAEQIASCKRHIRRMLDEDGFSDVIPDFLIEIE